jgi:hypothetical protein
MAYGDNTLNADHRWSFQNTLNDQIGSLNFVNTGTLFSTSPITRDGTHALQTNGRDDLITVAPTTDTGTAGLDRYAFQGFFMVDEIQGPPCMIYKQGGNTSGFTIFLWGGNNIMLQVKDTGANDNVQIFSNIALTTDRVYHLFVRYSGSGFSDEIEFRIDGIKQTASRNGVTPGTTSMTAHTGNHVIGENGSAGTEVNVGDETVIVKAPINGFWSEWWTWFGADAESLSDDEISDDLFGAGALPGVTISSDTEANMQIALDAISSTERPDEPLCILIEAVTGDGDISLNADDITFNDRSSIHVRYEGTGTLTWTNENGSNAERSSGNVTILNPSQLTLTNLDNPTEVRVYNAGTQTEVAGQEDVVSGSFSATVSVSSVDIRILSLSKEILKLSSIDMSSDITIDVQQFDDRQYLNP